MPSSDFLEFILLIALVAIASGIYFYSGYWAFTVRKVLAGHIYRRQALWVAVAGLYFALFFVFATIAIIFGASSNNFIVTVLGDAFMVLGFIIIFAWIDATIRVARRSDPLHRNTLHWAGFRYFLLVGAFFALLFTVVPAPFEPSSSSILEGSTLLAPLAGALLFGGLTLLVSARRARDAILRRHLKWFGIYIVFLFVTNRAEGEVLSRPFLLSNSILLEIITYALFIVSAYFLFKCARSLTSFSPYPVEEAVQVADAP